MAFSIIDAEDDSPPRIGTLTNGASTNDTNLDVRVDLTDSGAVANNTLRLYDGTDTNSPLSGEYTVTSTDVGNNFAIVPTGPLTNGTTYTITARLAQGTAATAPTQTEPSNSFEVTVDTADPAAPTAPALDDASDSGVKGDGRTSDTTPAFTGTAEPGSTVTLYDADAEIGTDVAGADGTWSITPEAPLASGAHSISADATDPAGNISDASTVFALRVDAEAPTLSGLAVSQDLGTAGIGDTITFTLTADEVVTVTGTPELALAEGRAATYESGSGGTTLTFTYELRQDDTAADLDVTALNLPSSATIQDEAGNVATTASSATGTPSGAGTLDIDADAPDAPAITSTGGPINSAAQTVTGTAEPDSSVEVFDGITSVGTADADEDGNWTANVTLPGEGPHTLIARATDAADNTGPESTGVAYTLDETAPDAPAIASVTDDIAPGTGALVGGGASNDTDLAVRVSLTDTGAHEGDTVRLYNGTDTTDPLGTSYTLQAADITAGFATVQTGTLTNGTTYDITARITDAADNQGAASDAFAVTSDTTAPTAPAITAFTPDTGAPEDDTTAGDATGRITLSGTADAGSTVTVTMSQDGGPVTQVGPVEATGGTWSLQTAALTSGSYAFTATAADAAGNQSTPSTALDVAVDNTKPVLNGLSASQAAGPAGVGDTITYTLTASETVTLTGSPELALVNGRAATYAGGSGTATLTFTYALHPGDQEGGLDVSALTLPGGAAIQDAAGNGADASAVIGTPAGALDVDADAPTVSAVVASPATDALTAGETVTLTLTMSEAVTVSTDGGTPGLVLSNDATAAYTATAGNDLTFTYTVAAGENSADLAVTSLSLNGGAIRDAAGNDAVLTGAAADPAGTLVIDTTPPPAPTGLALAAASDSGAQGDRRTNDTTPTLTGTAEPGSTVALTATPTSGGDAVALGTATADATTGAWTLTSNITLADAEYAITAIATDAAGNQGAASDSFALTVDATAPTAPGIASVKDDVGSLGGPLTAGARTDDAELAVTLDLIGTGARAGDVVQLYDGTGTGAPFSATYDLKLADILAHSVTLQTTTLSDGTTYDIRARVTDTAGNRGAASPAFAVSADRTGPALTGVTATAGADELRAGQTVTLLLTADGVVQVNTDEGKPTLELSNGGAAAYTGLSPDGRTLTFAYTVRPGDDAATLAVSILALNGATIQDAAGNDLDLAVTGENLTGVPVIDTEAPTVEAVAVRPGTGLVGIGGTIGLTLTMSEAVAVDTRAGAPRLTLNNGGTAAYDAADSTAASLAFTHTVAAGQSTADLAVVALDLNGATIRDAAGNAADPSGAAANPAGTLAVDAAAPAAPTVSVFASRPAGGLAVRGTAEAGSTVEVYQDAGPLGTVTAGSDGAWAVPLAGELDAGTYAFTATATDAAGNLSPTSSASTVTVEEQAPAGAEPTPVSFETGARGVEVERTEAGDLVVTRGGVTEVLRGADELRFIDGRLVFDPDDAASQVARLYRAGLGRGVDQGGLQYWAELVEDGTPLGALAQGFLTSPEGQALYGADSSNAEFVARLYRNVLGREGDEGGVAFWTRRLGEGAARADVPAAVADSGENRQATAPQGVWDLDEDAARVARLYGAVLGRSPDQGGLAYWTETVRAGRATLEGMAEGFMASPEFQAVQNSPSNTDFVRALYQNTLDRPGDGGGVDYWVARLDAGLSRAALVVSFSESQEHTALAAPDILGSEPGAFGIRLA